MKRPAVFFDRDNTLIASDGYLGDPAKVVLISGAADAVARARALGYAVVVVSNQSGVARGMFSEEDVQAVNQRMEELLKAENPSAVIDRHEFCPFHPDGTIDVYARESDRRKPGPGMIISAARAMALDLERSWMVGDAGRDIEAGKAAGVRGILFQDPSLKRSPAAEKASSIEPDYTVSTLAEAMDFIAGSGEEARDEQASASVVAPSDNAIKAANEPHSIADPIPATTRAMGHSAEPAALEAAGPAVTPAPIREVAPATEHAPRLVTAPIPISTSTAAPASTARELAAADVAPTRRVPKVAIGSKYVPPKGAAEKPMATRSAPMETIDESPSYAAAAPRESEARPRSALAAKLAARDDDAPRPQPPVTGSDRVEGLLEQIFLELRRSSEHHETDFSVSKLLAGIVQVIVLGVLFLGYLKRGKVEDLQTHLMLAMMLQTLTVSLLIMSRQK